MIGGDLDDEQEEEEEDEESSDESDGEKGGSGLYNPSDYAHLDVSSEIKDLFQYIQRYKPQKIDLETRLKPFIPGAPRRRTLAPPPPSDFILLQTSYPRSATLTPSLKSLGLTAKTVKLLATLPVARVQLSAHPFPTDVVGLTVLDEPAANQTDPTGAAFTAPFNPTCLTNSRSS